MEQVACRCLTLRLIRVKLLVAPPARKRVQSIQNPHYIYTYLHWFDLYIQIYIYLYTYIHIHIFCQKCMSMHVFCQNGLARYHCFPRALQSLAGSFPAQSRRTNSMGTERRHGWTPRLSELSCGSGLKIGKNPESHGTNMYKTLFSHVFPWVHGHFVVIWSTLVYVGQSRCMLGGGGSCHFGYTITTWIGWRVDFGRVLRPRAPCLRVQICRGSAL